MSSSKIIKEKIMKYLLYLVGLSNILLVFLIFIFIFSNGIKFFKDYSLFDFFLGTRWISLSDIYGILPLVVGTFWVSFVAILISVPVSVLAAIYISKYASKRVRSIFKILIEMMSAVPSVVLGFIGLYVFSKYIKDFFNLSSGLNAFSGGVMLALMAIPTIVGISDDAIKSVDKSLDEASLGLGANRLETIINVTIPAASSGILSGILLAFGRIIGETLTVLMVTGNAPIMAKSPLSSVRTLTATIAAEMGEVVHGSTHYHALFTIGIILFLISLFVNTMASNLIHKSRKS